MAIRAAMPLSNRARVGMRGITLIESLPLIIFLALISSSVTYVALPLYREAKLTQAKLGAMRIASASKTATLYTTCPTVHELVDSQAIGRKEAVDPWGLPYWIVCDDRLRVISSGPDRQWDTADDVANDTLIPHQGLNSTFARTWLAVLGSIVASILCTGRVLAMVRGIVGQRHLLTMDAVRGHEILGVILYPPIAGCLFGLVLDSALYAVLATVLSLNLYLLTRLAFHAAVRYHETFRIRDGAAFGRETFGFTAKPLSVVRSERRYDSGEKVHYLELILRGGSSLLRAYVDEASRDLDAASLVIPTSYRMPADAVPHRIAANSSGSLSA